MGSTFRRVSFVFSIGALLGGVTGCGSNAAEQYPDASPSDGAVVPEAGGRDGGASVERPEPTGGAGNILLARGTAQLLTQGPACTSETGGTGDRWCAFATPSTTGFGEANLFVLNVSRAAAGVSISCEGSTVDPNCLRLTRGFAEDETHAALFQGDTLLYFDNNAVPYGWRPGMSNGRALVTNLSGDVHDCLPSSKGNSVLCLRDLSPQPNSKIQQSELLVGQLDSAASPPLTKVDTVIFNDPADGPTVQRFRVGFRPSGDYVAWSSRAEPGGPEILKVQKVGDDSTRVTVASDVSRWSISPTGNHWFWLSQFNYNTAGMRSGTLQMAPFPAGTAPTTLLPNVGDFSVARNGSLVARAMVNASRGDLKGIVDPVAAPTQIASIASGVIAVRGISPQGHVAYTKNVDTLFGFVDIHVNKLDGTGTPCAVLTQLTGHPSVLFLPGSGGMVWARITNLDSSIDDVFKYRESFTRLSDCSTSVVAADVGPRFGIAGDDAILAVQEYDGVDGTLRIQDVTGGTMVSAGQPALIHTRVDDYLPVATSPGAVIFTVNAGAAADGLYLHTVAAGTAPAADGGTPDTSSDTSAD
ncbi:MAG: hypothetical protein ABUL77_01520 [Bacteroidota bacterium]